MPRFHFTVTRKEIAEHDFFVEADDALDAEEKAIEAAADYEWRRSGNVRYRAECVRKIPSQSSEAQGFD